jgi:hypothetical protein
MGANSSPQSLNLRVNGGCPKAGMIGVGRARVYRRFSSHPADSECFSVGDG